MWSRCCRTKTMVYTHDFTCMYVFRHTAETEPLLFIWRHHSVLIESCLPNPGLKSTQHPVSVGENRPSSTRFCILSWVHCWQHRHQLLTNRDALALTPAGLAAIFTAEIIIVIFSAPRFLGNLAIPAVHTGSSAGTCTENACTGLPSLWR